MTERRVLVTIDPPEPGRCPGCRWHRFVGPVFRRVTYCDLRIEVDPLSDDRPAACIAAEAEASRLSREAVFGGMVCEKWRDMGDEIAAPERDRVAEALAAVLGPDPAEI